MPFDSDFDRKTAITASEAVAVIFPKDSPWKTPMQVFESKIAPGTSDNVDTMFTRLGNYLEPFIGAACTQEYGWNLVEATKTKRHPIYDFIAATPDFLDANGKFGVEVKAIFKTTQEWGDETENIWSADELPVPVRYAVQCVINMAVHNVWRWELVALIDGKLHRYGVPRNLDYESHCIKALKEFWNDHVLANVPPPVVKNDENWLKKKFPNSSGVMITDEKNELKDLIGQYLQQRKQLEMLEADVGAIRSQLILMIRDADGISGDWGKVTYKSTKETEKTDWDLVALELSMKLGNKEFYDETVKRFTKKQPGSRRFLFTGAKK